MWDHLALLGPRRRSAHPRLERVCSLSVCQLFRLSRFVPDFNVSGKTAEPKMAFNFAHLLSAACGGAPRRLGRLRRPWARCARLFWGGYQHRKSADFLCLDMILIVNGSEPAKHRLQPHTRARHSSWRACASDALQAARVASEAGTTCSCCTSQLHRSVLAVYATAAACGIALVQLGDAGPSAGLIQCERTLCVAAGRWQCTAAHRLWRLVCPRQCC